MQANLMNSNQQRVNILVNVLNLSSDGAEKHLSEFQDNQEKKNVSTINYNNALTLQLKEETELKTTTKQIW